MREIILGKTGIKVPQNAFGALPIQRVDMDTAVKLLRRAYEGGMRFFDTARAYSDSEEKMGEAFGTIEGMREKIYISSKTMAKTPDKFSQNFLSEEWQGLMMKIEECVDCGLCKSKCPYELDTPNLLRKNLADYKNILEGKVDI